MIEEQMRPNLLTVIPGNITIGNFVPGRVYKETLMIYNRCNVPIIINLKSSDKSKLSISESKMRIGVNQAKKLDILIQDKTNYKYIKTPTKQKKLLIHMKGDLIDEKYEINLLYYDRNMSNNNSNRNIFNQNYMKNNRINPMENNEYQNQVMLNKHYSEIPQGYLTENPNNYIDKQSINIQNMDDYSSQYQPKYYDNNIIPKINNEQNNFNERNKMSNIPIEQNNNEQVISLKMKIKELNEQVLYFQSLLEQNNLKQKNINNNNHKYLNISHNSFYIFGSGMEKEIKNKYKIDDNIEIQRILSKNKILELENSTLLYRIKCLEKKLSLYNNDNNININYNNEGNENDMIDIDANLENNLDEEDNYLNEQNNNNDFLENDDMNYNKDRYKYIYEDKKRNKYLSNNINNMNKPSFDNKINKNKLIYKEKKK